MAARAPGWRPLSALLAGAGVLHLLAPGPYAAIVPRSLGDPRPWVLWSGVAELGCAAGLVASRTRALAGCAAAALFVAVYPANLVMAWRALASPRASGARRALTVARLPLQVPLVLWALDVARAATATTPRPRPWRTP